MFTATGFDEDIATITAGKEFTIVKTTGGKVRKLTDFLSIFVMNMGQAQL